VQNGHWREFHALLEELNATLRAKGLLPLQVWESSFGTWNGALLVVDYESLAAYEREHDAMHADPACMSLWRDMAPHFDGIPWTDLWWTPSEPR
jgi:NIPSNAP protein